MTVSVQQKKGLWYVVVSYKKENGKWATKWHKTGLIVKGNKKRAELMADEIMKQYKDGIKVESKWKVDEYILYWFNNIIKNTVEVTTWEGYGTVVETHLAPYFKAKNIALRELKTSDIQLYYKP